VSDQSLPPKPPTCTRAIPRQGASYMAFRREALDPDDPLLSFKPVPSKDKKPRHTAITPARQRAFIAALAESGIVMQAARSIGASTEALYRLRNKPGGEEFHAAWDAAIDRGIARLEDCALARAIEGEERMVVSGGRLLGYETRFNDALVMFFLRNRRAGRYGDDWRSLKPGHPAYERIREQVLADIAANEPSEQEVLDSIDAFIDEMRARSAANEALLAQEDAGGVNELETKSKSP